MSMQQNVAETAQDETETLPVKSNRGRRSSQPPTSSGDDGGNTGGSLTRVTANFTPRAMASLDRIASKTGDSRTDVLNMSVMVFDDFLDLLAQGDGRTLKIVQPNGEIHNVRFIGGPSGIGGAGAVA